MVVFHVFKIVQMVPNNAKHQIWKHLVSYLEPSETSLMEIFFAKKVNGFWLFLQKKFHRRCLTGTQYASYDVGLYQRHAKKRSAYHV